MNSGGQYDKLESVRGIQDHGARRPEDGSAFLAMVFLSFAALTGFVWVATGALIVIALVLEVFERFFALGVEPSFGGVMVAGIVGGQEVCGERDL